MAAKETIRPYESIVLVHPEASEQVQKDLFKKNASIIKEHSGDLNSVETWGKRFLANPIKKINKAIYFHTTFKANTETITELERTMRINDSVLRFMHVRLDDETDLNKHLDKFKEDLAEAHKRQKEFEAKKQKKAERFQKK